MFRIPEFVLRYFFFRIGGRTGVPYGYLILTKKRSRKIRLLFLCGQPLGCSLIPHRPDRGKSVQAPLQRTAGPSAGLRDDSAAHSTASGPGMRPFRPVPPPSLGGRSPPGIQGASAVRHGAYRRRPAPARGCPSSTTPGIRPPVTLSVVSRSSSRGRPGYATVRSRNSLR